MEACKIIWHHSCIYCYAIILPGLRRHNNIVIALLTCEMWSLPTNPSLLRKDRRNWRRMLCVIHHLPKSMSEVRRTFRTLNAPGSNTLRNRRFFLVSDLGGGKWPCKVIVCVIGGWGAGIVDNLCRLLSPSSCYITEIFFMSETFSCSWRHTGRDILRETFLNHCLRHSQRHFSFQNETLTSVYSGIASYRWTGWVSRHFENYLSFWRNL